MKMWTADQAGRLAFEANLLGKYYPYFQVFDPKGKTYIEGWLWTNAGSSYKLKIQVPDSFPFINPKLYVLEPAILYKYDGQSTINSLDCSRNFHTNSNGPGGIVQICHTHGWDSSLTFVQILKKARLWCEAYQAHLQTGKNISDFLGR